MSCCNTDAASAWMKVIAKQLAEYDTRSAEFTKRIADTNAATIELATRYSRNEIALDELICQQTQYSAVIRGTTCELSSLGQRWATLLKMRDLYSAMVDLAKEDARLDREITNGAERRGELEAYKKKFLDEFNGISVNRQTWSKCVTIHDVEVAITKLRRSQRDYGDDIIATIDKLRAAAVSAFANNSWLKDQETEYYSKINSDNHQILVHVDLIAQMEAIQTNLVNTDARWHEACESCTKLADVLNDIRHKFAMKQKEFDAISATMVIEPAAAGNITAGTVTVEAKQLVTTGEIVNATAGTVTVEAKQLVTTGEIVNATTGTATIEAKQLVTTGEIVNATTPDSANSATTDPVNTSDPAIQPAVKYVYCKHTYCWDLDCAKPEHAK